MREPEIVTPAGWPRGSGYAHGVIATGRTLSIAGQVGWDPLTRQIVASDFVRQAEQALANVDAVLRAAGGEPDHLVRVTWYITDRQAYLDATRALGAAWRARFGRHYPAMSVIVVAALLEPGALLEIEATALLPPASQS